MVVVESTYRFVARNITGEVRSISDLKGKKIATGPLMSAGYFVEKFLRVKGGLQPGEYTVVGDASLCLREPCGANYFFELLGKGAVDAVGMCEPLLELSVRAVGKDKVAAFADKSVYREVYSLWMTQAKLDDPERRASIVEFVRGLLKVQNVFDWEPERVTKRVGEIINVTEEVLKDVWKDHSWNGYLPTDLVDFITEEDKDLARVESRTAMAKEEITKMPWRRRDSRAPRSEKNYNCWHTKHTRAARAQVVSLMVSYTTLSLSRGCLIRPTP